MAKNRFNALMRKKKASMKRNNHNKAQLETSGNIADLKSPTRIGEDNHQWRTELIDDLKNTITNNPSNMSNAIHFTPSELPMEINNSQDDDDICVDTPKITSQKLGSCLTKSRSIGSPTNRSNLKSSHSYTKFSIEVL